MHQVEIECQDRCSEKRAVIVDTWPVEMLLADLPEKVEPKVRAQRKTLPQEDSDVLQTTSPTRKNARSNRQDIERKFTSSQKFDRTIDDGSFPSRCG